MDEEIMNFHWFDNVTSDSIKDLQGTDARSATTKVQVCLASKHNMLSYVPPFTITLPHWHPSQPGKLSCSAAGSSWDDLLSMRLRCAHYLDTRSELWVSTLGYGTCRM